MSEPLIEYGPPEDVWLRADDVSSVLMPEEWERGAVGFAEAPEIGCAGSVDRTPRGLEIGTNGDAALNPEDPVRIAAFLLQRSGPDGGPMFTWEDVDLLHKAETDDWDDWRDHQHERLRSLVARLSSLLPPRP